MSNEMPGLNRKLLYVCVLYICLVLGDQGKSQCRKISGQMLYVPSIVFKLLHQLSLIDTECKHHNCILSGLTVLKVITFIG